MPFDPNRAKHKRMPQNERLFQLPQHFFAARWQRAHSLGFPTLLVFLLFSRRNTRCTIKMSLIATIFALVFVTELISWIGKSVLLEFVSNACWVTVNGI